VPGRVLVLKNDSIAVVLQKLSETSVKVLALDEPLEGQV
jgi:hypothetical protein